MPCTHKCYNTPKNIEKQETVFEKAGCSSRLEGDQCSRQFEGLETSMAAKIEERKPLAVMVQQEFPDLREYCKCIE